MSEKTLVQFINIGQDRIYIRVYLDEASTNDVLNPGDLLEFNLILGRDRYCASKEGPLPKNCDEKLVKKSRIELK